SGVALLSALQVFGPQRQTYLAASAATPTGRDARPAVEVVRVVGAGQCTPIGYGGGCGPAGLQVGDDLRLVCPDQAALAVVQGAGRADQQLLPGPKIDGEPLGPQHFEDRC